MSQCNPASEHIRSSYLGHLFHHELRAEAIERLRHAIAESGVQFNAVAFRGWSGALIAPELASLLGCGLVGVRKDYDEEPAHGYEVEGHTKTSLRYIIVDDFISGGTTVKAIIEAISNDAKQYNMPDPWNDDKAPPPVTHTPVAVFLHREMPIKRDYFNHALEATDYPWGQRIHKEFNGIELPVYNCGLDKFLGFY